MQPSSMPSEYRYGNSLAITLRLHSQEMESVGIGSLLVHDEDNIVGIFTERDYLNKIAVKGTSLLPLSSLFINS